MRRTSLATPFKRKASVLRRDYLSFDRKGYEVKLIYIVAAISKEHGLESLRVYYKAIDGITFAEILEDVSKHGKDFVLCGHNVSYHYCSKNAHIYEAFDTTFIKSVEYTPELNATEAYFRVLKHHYKNTFLHKITLGQ